MYRNSDILKYVSSDKFSWDQINSICYGIKHNLDVSIYAKPEYDSEQMEEIIYGLEKKIACRYLC